MAQPRSDHDPSPSADSPRAGQPPRGEHAHAAGDLPRDHHPADARSPEDYTEPPGSHRKGGRHGPATDVGA